MLAEFDTDGMKMIERKTRVTFGQGDVLILNYGQLHAADANPESDDNHKIFVDVHSGTSQLSIRQIGVVEGLNGGLRSL